MRNKLLRSIADLDFFYIIALVFLIFFCLVGHVRAEEFEGFSCFGCTSDAYNVKGADGYSMCDKQLFIQDHARQPILPILWGTFDNGNPNMNCVYRFIARYQYKPHAIEIHLENGAGRNKGRINPIGDWLPGLNNSAVNALLSALDIPTLVSLNERVADIRGRLETHIQPSTTLILSTGLETKRTQLAQAVLIQHLRGIWPYLIVGNPTIGGSRGDTDLLEVHGNRACPSHIPCIANEDGVRNSLNNSKRFMQRNANAFARILWEPWGSNGKRNNKWTPHLTRDFNLTDKQVYRYAWLLAAY